jgi:hypothetical protein
MTSELYERLTTEVAAELADDWSPHVSVVGHINRKLEAKESTEVTVAMLEILKRMIEDGIVVPGELDPDIGFRFARYEGSAEEIWNRVQRSLPVGHHTKYEFHLWFDLGEVLGNAPKTKNC